MAGPFVGYTSTSQQGIHLLANFRVPGTKFVVQLRHQKTYPSGKKVYTCSGCERVQRNGRFSTLVRSFIIPRYFS